jgi:Ca2+-binding RTX toxin-like protein
MRSVTWVAGNKLVTIDIADTATSAQVRQAIQGALDAAAAAGQPASVTLSAGVFVIDGTGRPADGGLRVGSNVTFAGTIANGIKQSVIKLDDAHAGAVTGIVRTANAPGVHDVTIKNLVIQGNGTGNPAAVDGVYAGHAPGRAPDPALAQRDIAIDNVEVSNCSRYGVDPHEQIANLTIRNSTSFNNKLDGFTLDYVQGGLIENNLAHGNGRHGFNVVTGSHDLALKDNRALGNGANGLVIQPPSQGDGRGLQSHNIAVSGGEYAGNGESGIKINSATDITVEGASVHDNAQNGIRVGIAAWDPAAANYPPPASERIVIAGNHVANNGTPGASHAEIDLKASADARVEVQVFGNEIKATANVVANVDGNRYADGAATVSGLTIADNPKVLGAIAKIALTAGADTFASNTGRQYVNGQDGDDIIATGAGNDTALGGAGNDRLSGGAGNDVLIGGTGHDRLDGGTGSDWLSGGLGDDILLGLAGSDRLIGGMGRDVLTGGAGNDRFEFTALGESAPGADRDLIADFSRSLGNRDTIDLAALDANDSVAGNQSFAWVGTGAFTAAGQLRYSQTGGTTVVQASTDADSAAEFEIELTGLAILSSSDFWL